MTLYVPPQKYIATAYDTVDSSGQSCRLFLPPEQGPAPLLIWSHPQGGSQLIANDFAWPLVQACIQEGWSFAASANHGPDSWGSTNAQNDLTNLYNLVNGIRPVSKVVMIGASMGSNPTVLGILNNKVPNVKGAYIIDGAFNLAWMYAHGYAASIATGFGLTAGTLSAASTAGATSVSSTVSIPSGTSIIIDPAGTNPETVTTTGAPTGSGPYTIPVPALGFAHASGVIVSDYPTKTAGFDPALVSGASLPAIRWRSCVSTADTVVLKANNSDVFMPAAAVKGTEASTVLHLGSHISTTAALPADLVAFAKRCFA